MDEKELLDSVNRLKELSEKIKYNLSERRINLAAAQVELLISNLDVLEAEIKL